MLRRLKTQQTVHKSQRVKEFSSKIRCFSLPLHGFSLKKKGNETVWGSGYLQRLHCLLDHNTNTVLQEHTCSVVTLRDWTNTVVQAGNGGRLDDAKARLGIKPLQLPGIVRAIERMWQTSYPRSDHVILLLRLSHMCFHDYMLNWCKMWNAHTHNWRMTWSDHA